MSQKFQNTFAPNVENDVLTLDNIIKGLFLGAIEFDDLPDTIQQLVEAEMSMRMNQPKKIPLKEAATPEGHWVTIKGTHILIKTGQSLDDALKEHGIDLKPKKLLPEDKPHGQKPAFEGEDFEPIIRSDRPTQDHIKTASQVMDFHKNVFAGRKEFLVAQAWEADKLRAEHSVIADAIHKDLEKNFPSSEVSHRIKKRYNILEKMGRKPERYKTVHDLHDISGIKIVTNYGVSGMMAILDHIHKKYQVENIDNYVENPRDGYRAVQLDVKDKKSGLITEIQIKTPRQDKWAVWDHDFEYKPRTRHMHDLVMSNKDVIHQYALKMSDYYYALDNGDTNAKKPDCPEIVEKELHCLD